MQSFLVKRFLGSNHVGFLAAISILLFSAPRLNAEVGLRLPPYQSPMADFIRPPNTPAISVGDSLFNLPVQYPRSSQYRMAIDSSGQTVAASYTLRDIDILYPNKVSFSEYLKRRSRLELLNQWQLFTTQNYLERAGGTAGGRGIVIETPEIKSKAFKRVFGGGSIGLKVTGEITIDGNMRNERKSQVKTALNRAPNTNFQMKQTQRFKVEGKIGENVSVFVDQDSERPFEFDNALKLNYSSDEDGIVQSIEAGNVSLSLPGTRFVTFSAQSSGLFGIKSQFKVGGLDITAIASMEKGKKNTLTLDGGKVEEKTQISDYQYRRNSRFFIHNHYRDNYKNLMLKNRRPGFNPNNYVSKIEVYKSDNNYDIKSGSFEAWAAIAPDSGSIETFSEDDGDYKGYFVRLDPMTDYYVNKDLGFIELNMSLSESEVLAVAFRDSSKVYRVGDIPLDTTRVSVLKLIKPQNAQPADKTWNLEWKNIYSLGTRNIDKENFQLKLYYKPPSGDPQETITLENGEKKGSLEIFGLDQSDKYGTGDPDNIIDQSDYIIDYANGLLIFPDMRPFDPVGWGAGNESFTSELPDDRRTHEIYDETNDTKIRQASKFYIEINSASRSPVLQLGINVIPESEEVTLNGTKLVRETDYLINYFSGELTLLDEKATDPTAKLQVNYESQQMFAIDKKTLLGARAEYTLWESGSSRSFIGGTLIYLNQKTLDQRVRVGQESPMRNIVWDVNTLLEFQPGFIDKGLAKIPYLNAQGTSRVKFEGEIAQVIPNPNTLNNDATGDHDGVAYLDDFEGAKRDISLGVIYSGWGPSSIPSPSSNADTIDTYLNNRGSLYWYNPYGQIPIQEIWPDREVTTSYGGTNMTNVLSMVFKPNPTLKEIYGNTRRSWAGIMTGLSAGYANQEDSKFLEVWVKGDQGRLHVDLGWISEDVIPNRDFDSEDKVVGFFRNSILDDDEDTGLDGVFGKDPTTLFLPHEDATITNGRAEPYDFWDLNENGTKDPEEPWSYDDWKYSTQSADYKQINGYEESKNGSVAIYPNSEDLNGNSATDLINDYFEYKFSLDKQSSDTLYIVGGQNNEYGWRQYRIPLNKWSKIVGDPDWTRIRYARIWIDSVDVDALPASQVEDGNKYAFLSIAEINLVGNDWKFGGVSGGDTTFTDSTDAEEKFSIEVINTHENADIYTQPKGVEGVIDPIQKIRQREQALVLKFDGLMPGEIGYAQKTLYQNESLLDYKRLKMFVHGGGGDHSLNLMEGDTLEFFLRLGSGNTTDNYYEIRMPVYDGWNSLNEIEVDFEDFSRLKLLLQASGKDTIEEKQDNGHLLKISKKPSLGNVKWMIVGIQNKTAQVLSDEIWLDELRLSDVRKEKGMAMRTRAEVSIADLFSINGEYERRDADFHTVNEQFGQGSNSESKSVNANVGIHKFLPASLGLSMPVSVTYSQSNSTPKWLPGSDILVNRNTVRDDSLWQAIQNLQERKGFSVSLSKQTKSRNFLIRYIVDPVRTSFSYSLNHSSNSQQKYNDNIGLNGSLSYSLSFGNQNYFQPLKWLGQKGFLRKLSEAKLYYAPSNFSVTLQGSTADRNSETRDGLVSSEYTATYNQTFSTAYKPLSFLDFDYTRSYRSDMRNSGWEELFSSPEPGKPLNISQSAKSGFTPKLINWFNPSFRVSSNYQWDDNPAMSQTGTGTSASLSRNLTISGSFDPTKFVDMFKKKSGGARGTSSRATSVRRPRQKNPAEGEEPKEETKEKKPFPLLKVFSFTGALLSKIDPVSISYTINENDNRRAILDDPVWQYQFGFSKDPKVRINTDEVGSNAITMGNDARLSLGSGLKITQSFSIDLKYEFGSTETRGSQVMGTVNRSSFLSKNGASPFPNWSISWRGLEKIKFLKKWVRQASLTHTFSGRTQSTWNESKSNITQTTYSKDFRPFLSFNMTLVNGMTVSAQYQTTVSRTEQTATGTGIQNQRQTSNSFTMNTKYSKKGGLKLPFMKGKKLENNLDFQMAFGYNMNKSEQNKKNAAYQEMSNTSNWSLKPQVTYTFTSTVRGGSYLELGERKDVRQGSTKITAFGINASISLSGQ